MYIEPLPDVEYLRECFQYDHGLLYWKSRPRRHFVTESKWKRHETHTAGKEAGTVDKAGYKVVRLTHKGRHRSLRVHRIIYALHHGDTGLLIDHINHDRADNRIENLRAVKPRLNVANRRKRDDGRLRGAYFDKSKGRWLSQIKVNYKTIYLGRFDTAQQAHDAYMRAHKRFNGTDGKALQ